MNLDLVKLLLLYRPFFIILPSRKDAIVIFVLFIALYSLSVGLCCFLICLLVESYDIVSAVCGDEV